MKWSDLKPGDVYVYKDTPKNVNLVLSSPVRENVCLVWWVLTRQGAYQVSFGASTTASFDDRYWMLI